MGPNPYPHLARRLREAGCEPVRQGKGSHEIWFRPITIGHFSVRRDTV
ncbi:MAG: type II toxin-antitoxin system HicA family toxin [Rhizobiales bacterium]|nr:type II toxin-antitoxin system HicA family toxin [Hyphomicrobiales bacterium]